MVAYNHERYLAQALESALGQQASFPFEIVIGEDCSADRTRAIAEDYAARFPEKIRLLPSERNLGLTRNTARTLEACRGQYVAILEGDDFWTSPHKLQRQADYLDANADCAWAFTRSRVVDGDGAVLEGRENRRVAKGKYSLADYLERQFQPRFCTVMFRHRLFEGFPKWFYRMPTADMPLHVFNTHPHGLIGFVDEEMSAYRIHPGGVWSQGLTVREGAGATLEEKRKMARRHLDMVELLEAVDAHLAGAHRRILREQIAQFAEAWTDLNVALGDGPAMRRSALSALRAQCWLGRVPRRGLVAAWLRSWWMPAGPARASA